MDQYQKRPSAIWKADSDCLYFMSSSSLGWLFCNLLNGTAVGNLYFYRQNFLRVKDETDLNQKKYYIFYLFKECFFVDKDLKKYFRIYNSKSKNFRSTKKPRILNLHTKNPPKSSAYCHP